MKDQWDEPKLLEHHDRLIMIGVINDAIEDLVRSKFGDAAWEAIYTAAFPGQAIATFEHFKPYDDAATLALVGAAALALNVPAATVLELYGAHLVKYAAALFSAARTPRGSFTAPRRAVHTKCTQVLREASYEDVETAGVHPGGAFE